MLSFWPSLGLLVFFLIVFLECRAIGGRVTLPLGSFLTVFCYGCIGAPLLSLLLQQIPALFDSGAEPGLVTWLAGPPIEEFAKALPVLVLAFLTRESRRLSIADFTLIGFASGAGFGFVEANLNTFVTGALPGFEHLATLGFQTASSSDATVFFAGHPVSTALVGLAAGIGLRFLPLNAVYTSFPAIYVMLWVSFDHGIYNWKVLNADGDGALPQAHFAAELLHRLTLHGQLATWALVFGLIAAQFLEAYSCSRAAGPRRDLLLDREWRPWVINEWLVAVLRVPLGRAAVSQTLDYFRLRRAFFLATFEARRDSNDITLLRHARSLEERLKRERSVLFTPPSGTWLLPLPVLTQYVAHWTWRMRWVLLFAILLLLLFMLDPGNLPVSARQLLFGQTVATIVAVAGACFAVWRIVLFGRMPPPDPLAAEGPAFAGYYNRQLLLGCSLVCALFPSLAPLLGWKAFAAGGAFIGGYLPGWIAQGGNLQTLLGLGTFAGAVAPDPRPVGEALRHDIAAGDERIRRLGHDIEERAGSDSAGSLGTLPLLELDPFLEAMAELDSERDAQARRQFVLDEYQRHAGEATIKNPVAAVQAVKDEFDRLAGELLEAAGKELDAIAAIEQAYGKAWSDIMRTLDAHDASRRRLTEPLLQAWQDQNDVAWALRIADGLDECLLPMQVMLLPELEALAGTARSAHAGRLAAGVERIRSAAAEYSERDSLAFALGQETDAGEEAPVEEPSEDAPKPFGLRSSEAPVTPAATEEVEAGTELPQTPSYQEALDRFIDATQRDTAYLDTIKHLERSDESLRQPEQPDEAKPPRAERRTTDRRKGDRRKSERRISEPPTDDAATAARQERDATEAVKREPESLEARAPAVTSESQREVDLDKLIDSIKRSSGYLDFVRDPQPAPQPDSHEPTAPIDTAPASDDISTPESSGASQSGPAESASEREAESLDARDSNEREPIVVPAPEQPSAEPEIEPVAPAPEPPVAAAMDEEPAAAADAAPVAEPVPAPEVEQQVEPAVALSQDDQPAAHSDTHEPEAEISAAATDQDRVREPEAAAATEIPAAEPAPDVTPVEAVTRVESEEPVAAAAIEASAEPEASPPTEIPAAEPAPDIVAPVETAAQAEAQEPVTAAALVPSDEAEASAPTEIPAAEPAPDSVAPVETAARAELDEPVAAAATEPSTEPGASAPVEAEPAPARAETQEPVTASAPSAEVAREADAPAKDKAPSSPATTSFQTVQQRPAARPSATTVSVGKTDGPYPSFARGFRSTRKRTDDVPLQPVAEDQPQAPEAASLGTGQAQPAAPASVEDSRAAPPAKPEPETQPEKLSDKPAPTAPESWLADFTVAKPEDATPSTADTPLEPIEWPVQAPIAADTARAADTATADLGIAQTAQSADSQPSETAGPMDQSAETAPPEATPIEIAQTAAVPTETAPAAVQPENLGEPEVPSSDPKAATVEPVQPAKQADIKPVESTPPAPSPAGRDKASSKADRLSYLLAKLEGAMRGQTEVATKSDAKDAAPSHGETSKPTEAPVAKPEPKPLHTQADATGSPQTPRGTAADTDKPSVEAQAGAVDQLKPEESDRLSRLLTKLFDVVKESDAQPRPTQTEQPPSAAKVESAAASQKADLRTAPPSPTARDGVPTEESPKAQPPSKSEATPETPAARPAIPEISRDSQSAPQPLADAARAAADTHSTPALKHQADQETAPREAPPQSEPRPVAEATVAPTKATPQTQPNEPPSEPQAKTRRAEDSVQPHSRATGDAETKPAPQASPDAKTTPAPQQASPEPTVEAEPPLREPSPEPVAETEAPPEKDSPEPVPERPTPTTTPRRDWKLAGARAKGEQPKASRKETVSDEDADTVKKSEPSLRVKLQGSRALVSPDEPTEAAPRPMPMPGKYYGPRHAKVEEEHPTNTPSQHRAVNLADALTAYYTKAGQPQPPMHTTDRASLQRIIAGGKLEAPRRRGAPWSTSGMSRRGEVAIRLKPGSEKFVEFVPSKEIFGQVPHYYPRGVGKGPYVTAIPIGYLEYFDVAAGKWASLEGSGR